MLTVEFLDLDEFKAEVKADLEGDDKGNSVIDRGLLRVTWTEYRRAGPEKFVTQVGYVANGRLVEFRSKPATEGEALELCIEFQRWLKKTEPSLEVRGGRFIPISA